MTEQDFPKSARPLAPGPSVEDELRKVTAARLGERQSLTKGVGSVFGGSSGAVSPNVPRGMPTGSHIAQRLGRALERLRAVESYAEGIAVSLAGPSAASRLAPAPHDQSAETLFVIYERTLDEIDRIIDNIENEQARTRNILGD